ncbi:hypothetical protein Ancab_009811 [Ancistrocladus abbreviatus]
MVMEAFALLKFWRTTTAKVSGTTTSVDGDSSSDIATVTEEPVVEPPDESDNDGEEYDDEESFFELELTLPDCDFKCESGSGFNLTRNDKDADVRSAKRVASSPISSKIDHSSSLKAKIEVEDSNSKVSSKPQSPISILRSVVAPPTLLVFLFGKLGKSSRRQKLEETSEAESISNCSDSAPKQSRPENQRSRNLFKVKFRIEEASSVLKFTPSHSSRLLSSPKTLRRTSTSSCSSSSSDESSSSTLEDDGSSKRFSKDVVQKYLNIIKPLYLKVSKKSNDKEKPPPRTTTVAALFQSPASPGKASMKSPSFGVRVRDRGQRQSSRFKVSYKHLRKSRSASDAVGIAASFPASRKDDSLIQQNDGIEGAILHCKRSLNPSRDRSSLSRCTSDTSHEKSSQIQMSESE